MFTPDQKMYVKLIVLFLVLLTNVSGQSENSSQICGAYINSFRNILQGEGGWAIEMLDASSKFPSGVMSGNLIDLGAFDQCLGINYDDIKGKYCLVKLPLPPEMMEAQQKQTQSRSLLDTSGVPGITLAWCIPDSCSIDDVTSGISTFLNTLNITSLNITITGNEFLCQTKENMNEEVTPGDWTVIGFFIFILVVVVCSTAYDMYMQHNTKEPAHILFIAFSIVTNGKKLLAVSNNPAQLPCLHGIRFISMMWVVVSHKFIALAMSPVVNSKETLEWMSALSSYYIVGATVAVDTFLLLSGLLVSYGFLLAKEKGVPFNVPLYYLHRYIRLTPALAVVVLIHATILNHMGSGPYWPIAVAGLKDDCVEYWWSVLLYTQNYVNSEAMCMPQSWYLSVDTQLFVLSPLILIPLWRWPRPTIIASFFLILGSIASSFAVTWHYKLPGALTDFNDDYQPKYYEATHTRYGPWVMGIVLGYLMYKVKKNNKQIKLHSIVVMVGWIVAIATMLAVVYGSQNLTTHKYDRWESSVFNGLHRHAFALGVSWVIYACTQGYGGPINVFLSWSVFQVLGRFTYTMYLVHLSLQFLWAASARTSTYFTHIAGWHGFWGDFFFTLFLSICLTLSFESPMLTIEKVLFKRGSKKSELPTHQRSDNEHIENGHSNRAFVK